MWNEAATAAFTHLKQALSTAPVLRMPDFTLPFVIEADASGFGSRRSASPRNPFAHYSKTLGMRGRSKSIYEKELMVVVLSVQKWRHYLLGRHFIIHTDEQSLIYLLNQREVGPEY